MKLQELLDVALLEEHVKNRVVSARPHPSLPLVIYNYTDKATYDEVWDGVTTLCRGLIAVKESGEILARPFPKFWNLGQYPETRDANLPPVIPEVTEKLDGSLGIFWQYEGNSGIATRGVFDSEQAIWATAWWEQHAGAQPDPRLTWLFEIIFRENRIVCDYDFEGLVLLAAIHTNTGVEQPRDETDAAAKQFGLRRPKRFSKSLAECLADNIINEEGYVLTWRSTTGPSLRAKVKFADYVRLHKMLTGMSERDVWEILSIGKEIEPLLDRTPEDFNVWVLGAAARLKEAYQRLENQAEEIFREARARVPGEPKDRETRKALAAAFVKHPEPLPAVLFCKLDGQSDKVRTVIWKYLYPEGGKVFKIVKEDRA